MVNIGCHTNLLTALPTLPTNLIVLYCYNNQLTVLPSLPNTMTDIDCENNKLTNLPILPTSLTGLRCGVNKLTSLPNLPSSLSSLNCWYNQLTTLPALPNSLLKLYCGNNKITTIPAPLPSGLTELFCTTNNLTALPTLPNSIKRFDCSWNKITSLNNLPTSLEDLYCYENQLTILPAIPSSCKTIYCYSNLLNSLPAMPPSVTKLYCYNNNLAAVPQSIYYQELGCQYNPIYCLSTLGSSLTTLSVPNTVTCLPNQPASLTNFKVHSGTYGSGNFTTTLLPVCASNVCSASCPLTARNFSLSLSATTTCSYTIQLSDAFIDFPNSVSCLQSQGITLALQRSDGNGGWATPIMNANDIGKQILCRIIQSNNLNYVYFTCSVTNGTGTACTPIPVELVEFKAQYTEGGNLLTWRTASERNTDDFDIEKSSDGKVFEKIGTVKAKGNSQTPQYYAFSDDTPFDLTYYRLKINDLDNKNSYSKTLSVSQKGKLAIKIYPNPAKDNATIDLGEAENATIRLIDVLGKEMLQKNGQSGQVLLNFLSLPNGIYFVEIKVKGVAMREKIVKN